MSVPNPGSDAARELGCTCAVMDNNHGRWAPRPPDGWWISEGCPVHDPASIAWDALALTLAESGVDIEGMDHDAMLAAARRLVEEERVQVDLVLEREDGSRFVVEVKPGRWGEGRWDSATWG